MFNLEEELRQLVERLNEQAVSYALCGALALAVHGVPRATLDIDLLALEQSSASIRKCARSIGFTLGAAPMSFGDVQIHRVSKAVPPSEDVLVLDVLSLPPFIERQIVCEAMIWNGMPLRVVSRASMIVLKNLRGSAQDLADIANLQ